MKYNVLMTRQGFAVTLSIVAVCLIAAGATVDPKDRFTARQRNYWAFQPVRRPETPAVKHQAWVRNPIDAFILAKLEDEESEADLRKPTRSRCIRRATFDLIGSAADAGGGRTPSWPTSRRDAYEKVVDRLLASPHYGERWARHWLDLARYAESDGFKADEHAAQRLALPRLRHPGLQRGQALRPLRPEQIAGDEL